MFHKFEKLILLARYQQRVESKKCAITRQNVYKNTK